MAYNHLIQGLIYNTLRKDEDYASFLHNKGYVADHNQVFKLFTFGSLRGQHRTEEKDIIFSDMVDLEIRSADALFIQILLTTLRPGMAIYLGKNILAIQHVRFLDKTLLDEKSKIRMVTPLTVHTRNESGNTLYYTPDEDSFFRAVENNAWQKWKSVFGAKSFDLFVGPNPDASQYRKQICHFKDEIVEGYKGSFYLEGSPKCINFLYNTGLGAGNSKGFGMFEKEK